MGPSEVDAIFDAFGKFSEALHLADERRNLEIAKIPRCGSCDYWMKSNRCPAERNVKGRTVGQRGSLILGLVLLTIRIGWKWPDHPKLSKEDIDRIEDSDSPIR